MARKDPVFVFVVVLDLILPTVMSIVKIPFWTLDKPQSLMSLFNKYQTKHLKIEYMFIVML